MLGDLTPIVFDMPTGQDVKIYPVGDLHFGSPQFMFDAWDRFSKAVADEPNSYLMIVGDMMNNGLKNSLTNVYEETVRPMSQKKWLAEQLEPLKDKIICGVSGNHERRSLKDADDDPMYDVFCKLNIEDRYRENAAFTLVRFGVGEIDRRGTSSRTRPCYAFCVTHGAGGGMYIGSSANRVERFGYALDGVDCIVTGHTHKPLTYPSAKLVFDARNKIVARKQYHIVTVSSWLDYGGYPIQKLLSPTATVQTEIILSSYNKQISIIHK